MCSYYKMFSLCIPTIERFDEFLSTYIPKYLNNELINEIIITDENGNDIEKISKAYDNPKLRLYKNDNVLGPFLNKLKCCSLVKNEWIVLIDSDNFADIDYFVRAKKYIEENIGEQKNIILAPCKAMPNFDYSHLSGEIFKANNFEKIKEMEKRTIGKGTNSIVLMNTGNYVINKYLIDNLNLSNEKTIHLSSSCDVIYLNTLLFEQLDLNLHVVPNMKYEHVVHDGSIYMKTHHQFVHFSNHVHNRYYNLK